MLDSGIQQISDYMTSIGDDDYILDDYTIIDGEVRLIATCTQGELHPDSYDEFGYPI